MRCACGAWFADGLPECPECTRRAWGPSSLTSDAGAPPPLGTLDAHGTLLRPGPPKDATVSVRWQSSGYERVVEHADPRGRWLVAASATKDTWRCEVQTEVRTGTWKTVGSASSTALSLLDAIERSEASMALFERMFGIGSP